MGFGCVPTVDTEPQGCSLQSYHLEDPRTDWGRRGGWVAAMLLIVILTRDRLSVWAKDIRSLN